MKRLDFAHRGHFVTETFDRFARKDDGTVTLFGVLMFILMVTIGGIAIDVVRYETQRVQLQYTLDRAVLAAAALDQQLDPEDVVRDYFARSGLERYRLRVESDSGLVTRSVTASVEMDVDTMFMDMFGIRALTSPASSSAIEQVPNVEIALVLDVSGSMADTSASGSTKLFEMQTAASEFITTVLAGNDPSIGANRVSVSLVPYAGNVNAGSTIESVFDITNEHSYSTCTRFSADQMTRLDLGEFESIQRMGHFDQAYRTFNSYFTLPYCPVGDTHAIMPWSANETQLTTEITNLTADGWTAIDQGMRWAVALVDPSSSDELAALNTAGVVLDDFVGRPSAYNDEEGIKIIVLMTDGENTDQWDVGEPYRAGPSTIFYHEDDRVWSMYVPGVDQYWIPNRINPDGSNDFWYWYGTWSNQPYDGANSEALSWQYMFANYTQAAIAWSFYYYPSYWSGNSDYFDELNANALVKCSREWVRQLINDGELEALKVGKGTVRKRYVIPDYSLEDYIRRRTVRQGNKKPTDAELRLVGEVDETTDPEQIAANRRRAAIIARKKKQAD